MSVVSSLSPTLSECTFGLGSDSRLASVSVAKLTAALLVQSILLIISQTILLWICLYYAPKKGGAVEGDEEEQGHAEAQDEAKPRRRPFNFWQWEKLGTYLEFLAGLIVILTIAQPLLGRFRL